MSTTDGRSTRWDAHRAERREKIVDAALALLAETGPEFGLDQVAARVGVTKPVIYRFFGDRAALIAAMGDRATGLLAERLMPALYSEVGLVPRIRAVVDALLRFLEEWPSVYWLFARPVPGAGGDVVRRHKEFVASALAGLLSEYIGQQDVDPPPDFDVVWAHGLVGFVHNAAEWWLEHRTIARDEVADQITQLVWAQIDGISRAHGVHLDPDTPFP